MYRVHCTEYSVLCIVCSVQCAMYSVQCVVPEYQAAHAYDEGRREGEPAAPDSRHCHGLKEGGLEA